MDKKTKELIHEAAREAKRSGRYKSKGELVMLERCDYLRELMDRLDPDNEHEVDDDCLNYYLFDLLDWGVINDFKFPQDGETVVYLKRPAEPMGEVEVYEKTSDLGEFDGYVCFRDGKERPSWFWRQGHRYKYVGDYKPGDSIWIFCNDVFNYASDEFDSRKEAEQAMKEYCDGMPVEELEMTEEEFAAQTSIVELVVTDEYWNEYPDKDEVICAN